MSVPAVICVSTRIPPLQHNWTAPMANGTDAQLLKTNPSHREKKSVEVGEEGGEGASQEVGKKTMASLYFMVLKRPFITVVSLSRFLAVFPWRDSNPYQTHLWEWT